jgi:flagellar hook-length control protein FliK
MEASLLAVTPSPMPPQEAPSQTAQTTEDASPFTAFLSSAITAGKTSPNEKKEQDPESASTADPSQQELSLAAALTALSFQDIPTFTAAQLVPEQDMATTPTNITNNTSAPTLLAPGDLNELQALLKANGQDVSVLTQDDIKQFQAMLSANGQNASGLTQDNIKQFQAMPSTSGQTISGLTPAAAEKQATPLLNTTETLINQQLQAILTSNPQNTLSIHTPHQSTPTETLNTLSSPYLRSADSSTQASLIPVQGPMLEGAVTGAKETNTLKNVQQNIAEQFLHSKFEGLVEKNNSKSQQQDNGRQENSQNQQNTANATLTTSTNTNEQTSQFNVAALGVPVVTATTANTPVTHPAALPPSIFVPAEELISHLVDRFSTNPRLQTSKVSLNLNPAELGALKIDIMVKGDSIKAHIIAGSQQIQDTIEKNMPKLRSVLEQQGFKIEDFQVTLESTNPDASNSFQQQFSSRRDSMPQTISTGIEDSFDFSLNSAEAILNASTDSGVNLNI